MNKKIIAKSKEIDEFFSKQETPYEVAYGLILDAQNIILKNNKKVSRSFSNLDPRKCTLIQFAGYLLRNDLGVIIKKGNYKNE
jgi:hypothetical protein